MGLLENKIDFEAIVIAENANPNGDPLDGNRPRVTDDGYGEMSDVCIKRKIRNRFIDMGENVFVQSDDKKIDEYNSLRERSKANSDLMDAEKKKDRDKFAEIACSSWIDVRSFGQVFAFKGKDGDSNGSVSVGVRGPVTVQSAFTVNNVSVETLQITKSVNSEENDMGKKGSDTMGMKHRISFGLYVIKGSINVQLAEKTGFTDDDADKIKEAIRTLFVNDCSSARPEGSMTLHKLFWWKHNCKIGQYSSKTVHDSLHIQCKDTVEYPKSINDFVIECDELEGLKPEIVNGL